MHKKTLILFAILSLMIPALAIADEATELKNKIFMDQKKLMVMESMEFTAEEAKNFWPVYEKYQPKLFESSQQFIRVISSYASVYKDMKDEPAVELVDQYIKNQGHRQKVMEQYVEALKKVLPGKQVFRCVQIESKLESIARYEMAKQVPLAK